MQTPGGYLGGGLGGPPPPPRDDLRFSNTVGILQKKKTMWLVSQLRHSLVVHPLLKKILDPPLNTTNVEFIVDPKVLFHG